MAKASGGPQAPALAARNRGKWQKSRAGIEPTTLRNTARDLSDGPSVVKSKSARRMQLYIIQSMDNGIQSIQRGVAGARSAPRAISTRARRAETQKNEQSTHADGGSMGPSALDQEIGTTRSCVLGRQISRGLRSMPRQWQ